MTGPATRQGAGPSYAASPCNPRRCDQCGITACDVTDHQDVRACPACHAELVAISTSRDLSYRDAERYWATWRRNVGGDMFARTRQCANHTTSQPKTVPA